MFPGRRRAPPIIAGGGARPSDAEFDADDPLQRGPERPKAARRMAAAPPPPCAGAVSSW